METAIIWHKSPFEFLALSDCERAMMTAHYRERRLRKGLQDSVQAAVADKKSNKPEQGRPKGYEAFGL